MPTLSDASIFEALKTGSLIIEPLLPNNVQMGSIDLTLNRFVEKFEFPSDPEYIVDLCDTNLKASLAKAETTIDITDGYIMQPGEYLIGHSAEFIRLPSYINGEILNRNSLAIQGLNAAISQYINPGFHGNKIIVLQNISTHKLKIRAGMRICQLVLFKMESPAIRDYDQRHSLEKLEQFVNQKLESNKNYDTSIADFMNEMIHKIATSR